MTPKLKSEQEKNATGRRTSAIMSLEVEKNFENRTRHDADRCESAGNEQTKMADRTSRFAREADCASPEVVRDEEIFKNSVFPKINPYSFERTGSTTLNGDTSTTNMSINYRNESFYSDISNEESISSKCCKSEKTTDSRYLIKERTASLSMMKKSSIFLLLRISGWSHFARFFLMVAILCCSMDSSDGYVSQRFAMEPQDQTAVINSRVTLPCRVTGKSGVLQWTKDDFGLGPHRNLSGYERYSMIGSDEEGDFSLDIASLTLDDDAKYQCQVSSGPQGQPGIRSRYAILTVLVPPEPPVITQGAYLATTEDREVELECVSVGGKPASEITWIDGNGGVLQGSEDTSEPLQDGRLFTTRSKLRMTPRREHHNQTFTCQAQNTADRTYKAAKITLEVKYAPKVRVSVVSGATNDGRIPEGAEVRIACKADANPNDLTYKWYLNDELVVGDYTTEMPIFNVTRRLHDAIAKCEVHNEVGKSEESETLDVSYAPRFLNRPVSVEGELGSSVNLSCIVDGNPEPQVTWFQHQQDRIMNMGKGASLTLQMETHTPGKYTCKVVVPGYPEIEADANIYLKGPPTIVSHRTQFGLQGDNVRVECIAFSIPKAERVTWTFNGREINTVHDQDYSILEDPLAEGVKSTLIIRESQSKHFGLYNCSVSNDYGMDMAEIILKPQTESFPLLLILFGVTSGIVVIAAFAMLLVLCQRRRRRKEACGKKPDVMADVGRAGDLQNCKESDRSSNISDLKMELRQADAGCELDYSSQDYSCSGSSAALQARMGGGGGGIPLAGPVPVSDAALLSQYTRYSNDYSDPAYTTTHALYKDGHNNNGYVPYVDYARDYNPPILHLQSPPHSGIDTQTANRIQLTSLHSNNHLNQLNQQLSNLNSNGGSLNGSLTRSVDTTSTLPYGGSQNNSLQRSMGHKHQDSNGALNSLGLPMMNDPFNGVTVKALPNGVGLPHNGVDVRYAATYGNPYLRTNTGLGAVHTANPAATPAPPPYTPLRHSGLSSGLGPITSPTSINSSNGYQPNASSLSITTSANSAQPQVPRPPPQSPSSGPHSHSHYILPPSSQGAQMVQLTKKGNGNQPSLATHV